MNVRSFSALARSRPAYVMPCSAEEVGQKGAAQLFRVPPAGCHKQSSLNCTGLRPSSARPGYRRMYGETTKCASEASVFIFMLSYSCDGRERLRSDPGRLYVSAWEVRIKPYLEAVLLLLSASLHRQGYSTSPRASTKVANGNLGTARVCLTTEVRLAVETGEGHVRRGASIVVCGRESRLHRRREAGDRWVFCGGEICGHRCEGR
jgi:hypothetical protein